MSSDPTSSMQKLQNDILAAIATGVPFAMVAERICIGAESLVPDSVCSILSVDAAGHIHPIAAPSLPAVYADALEGIAIGPDVGCCGSAAFLGEEVVVIDLSTDPRCTMYRALAEQLGLKACWSTPIQGHNGQVLATFAFHYRTHRGPTPLERHIVEACLQLFAIAMEHEEAQRRNRHLAEYDQLTELPNRRCFNDLISARLYAPRPGFGLLLVDIDHLKSVNDTMGHLVGDLLIAEVARRLREASPAAHACRIGGDEFAVIVDGCADHDTLSEIARLITAKMREPLSCGRHTLIPQVTIGGVVHGIDGRDGDVLRQNADFALYHAKATQRGRYVAFTGGLRTAMTQRLETIRMVDKALTEGRVVAHYQQIVALDRVRVSSVEALARIRNENGDILAAGLFQEALSDPNICFRLTEAMLACIVSDIQFWSVDGVPLISVAINLSGADLQRRDFEDWLTKTFEAAGLPFDRVILEVTESVLMNSMDESASKALRNLRARGVRIALDDFGTGYASLTHLMTFPVDILKIDKSFVDRLMTDRPSQVIVQAIIDIARQLDIALVAEGIECETQANRLRALGCDFGQGYFFARPAPAELVGKLVRRFTDRSETLERAPAIVSLAG